MKKQLLALGIITLMSVFAFGCSSDNNQKQQSLVSNQNTTQSTEIETPDDGTMIINDFIVEGSSTYTIVGYVGNATDLTIPKELNGIRISTICHDDRSDENKNTTVKTLRIEEGSEVSFQAFSGFTVLEELILPQKGDVVFLTGCATLSSVKKIVFTESVTSIDNMAFFKCKNLETIEFRCADGYYLGSEAFDECVSLSSVTFTSGKPSICYANAFNHTKVSELHFPEVMNEDSSVDGKLEGLENLTTVSFVNGCNKFKGTFVIDCPNLKTIDLNELFFSASLDYFDGTEFFNTAPNQEVNISFFKILRSNATAELLQNAEKQFSNLKVTQKNTLPIKPGENNTAAEYTTEILEIEGTEFSFSFYEAENATIAGGATDEGSYVGWVGKGGYTFFDNITVDKSGTYYIILRYLTEEERDFQVSIDELSPNLVICPSSGNYHSATATVYFKFYLSEGTHTIKVFNELAYAPNLDAIGLTLLEEH